jgi:hypothetical protein
MNRIDGPDPANCILCSGTTGPGCPYHPRPKT